MSAGGPGPTFGRDGPAQAISPIALLARMEARAKAVATALPQPALEVAGAGRYIGFRLGAHRLLASMQDIIEILPYPDLSRVPGAKPWLRGISQIRGRLVSVVDTSMFLGGPPTATRRGTRLLVIAFDEILAGLMLDEVFGMKQAPGPSAAFSAAPEASWLARAVSTALEIDDEPWGVLDLRRLTADPEFVRAAA